MKVRVETREIGRLRCELLAVLVPQIDTEKKRVSNRLHGVDRLLGGQLARVVESGDFLGNAGESLWLFPGEESETRRVLLLGVGSESDLQPDSLRRAAGSAVGQARSKGVTAPVLQLLTTRRLGIAEAAQACAEGGVLASYRSDSWKTKRDQEQTEVATLSLLTDGSDTRRARSAASKGVIVAEGQNLARQLSNEPPNDLTPAAIAREAQRMAKDVGLRCRVMNLAELKKRKMGALLAVGQGSVNTPRVAILEYQPKRGRRKPPTICIVGKGITFDSGGISLKPGGGMQDMKHDMSGAATVIGLMRAVAQLKPAARVIGVVAAAENLPDGNAYRPGDILTSMSGKTIEIQNTDAEGRLILADALHLANTDFKPDAIIDLATLTGACVVALGSWATGLFSNREALVRSIRSAGEHTGERVWPLPVWDEHREHMRSQIADLKNVGGRDAGSSTAAAFLSRFIGETAWAHLDIAGTAWTSKSQPHQPYGATGVGVRLLAEVIENWPRGGVS
jgi:leucyl aminopeptidase